MSIEKISRPDKLHRQVPQEYPNRVPTLTEPKNKPAKAQPDQSEIASAMKHYRALRWFAVISMLAIISWVLIDLFGPIPKYQLNNPPSADLNSREYMLQLEALAASRIEPHTHIEALPNGVNFYEAEIARHQSRKAKRELGSLHFCQG